MHLVILFPQILQLSLVPLCMTTSSTDHISTFGDRPPAHHMVGASSMKWIDDMCSSRLGHVCACAVGWGGSYWSSCIGCAGTL